MSKVTKSLEESYEEYVAEQQKKEIERLASYQGIKEWLDSLEVGDPRVSYSATLKRVLYLAAHLVTSETWEWEDIIGQIEEALR